MIDYNEEFILGKLISSIQNFSNQVFGTNFEIITLKGCQSYSSGFDYCSQMISYGKSNFMFTVNIDESIIDKTDFFAKSSNLSEKTILAITTEPFGNDDKITVSCVLMMDIELINQLLASLSSYKIMVKSNDSFFELFFVGMANN